MELSSAREQYKSFVSSMRRQGWTDSDVKEYSESIGVLMANDDQAALALFPAGTYPDAESARADARKFWKNHA